MKAYLAAQVQTSPTPAHGRNVAREYLQVLNNALRQTGWSDTNLTEHTWREVIRSHLQTVDWSQAVMDVRPFWRWRVR